MAFPAGHGRAPIEGGGELQPQERLAPALEGKKTRVQKLRGVFFDPNGEGKARLPKPRQPRASHLAMGVTTGDHYPGDARSEDCIHAGRRTAVVITRFESDVEGSAPGSVSRFLQRRNLRVGTAGACRGAPANDDPIGHHHSAHGRIRPGAIDPLLCLGQGLTHEGVIGALVTHALGSPSLRPRRSISSWNSLTSWKSR